VAFRSKGGRLGEEREINNFPQGRKKEGRRASEKPCRCCEKAHGVYPDNQEDSFGEGISSTKKNREKNIGDGRNSSMGGNLEKKRENVHRLKPGPCRPIGKSTLLTPRLNRSQIEGGTRPKGKKKGTQVIGKIIEKGRGEPKSKGAHFLLGIAVSESP